VNYANLAAVTILAYDTLLSIDDEITHVWRSKWTFMKFMYIASKYLAFLDGSLILLVYFDSNMGSSTCSTIYSATTYIIVAGVVLTEIILLLRTYALWGLSRYVLWYIAVFDIGCVILAVIKLRSSMNVNNVRYVPSPIPTIRHCFPVFGDKRDEVYIDFMCVMAAELNVLLLTLWRGVRHWKRSGNQLVRIFYRDGVIYLVSLVVISSINVVINVIDDLNFYYNVMLESQRIAHAVLSAHLILNVRKLKERSNNLPGDADLDSVPVSLELKSLDTETQGV